MLNKRESEVMNAVYTLCHEKGVCLISPAELIALLPARKHYTEEGLEEVTGDGTSQPEDLFFRIEEANRVMSTFETLNYRERAIVADHLGFCRECYATDYYDYDDLDESGKPKRKPRRKVPFIELAVAHGLASPDTADKTYRRALHKMRNKLTKSNTA